MVDFWCIVFPLAFSFHPRIHFNRQYRFFVVPCLFTAFFFLIWDIIFTKSGIWSFNDRYIVGLNLFSLPLEEYLFFFCIPYACVFTYYVITRYARIKGEVLWSKWLTYLLVPALAIAGLMHQTQYYTSVTFLLLAPFLLFLTVRKVKYLAAFYISYGILLVPFFFSNGVLTGSFFNRVVVSYNNNYNLGIRLFTIPFEDIFYGMLMILMNVAGFEYLKNRALKKAGG